MAEQVKLRITSEIELQKFPKNKGFEIDFKSKGKLLGELKILGAYVLFRRTRNSNWSLWSYSDFTKLLEDNKNA